MNLGKKLEILSNEEQGISRRNFLIGLVGVPILLSGCATYEQEIKDFLDYNHANPKFCRTIDKEYLKNFVDWSLSKDPEKNEKRLEYMDYLDLVNLHEESFKFKPLKPCSKVYLRGEPSENITKIVAKKKYLPPCQSMDSVEKMYLIAIENMTIIKKIDNKKINQLRPEEISLKILLNDLNIIYKTPFNIHEKLDKMYDCISHNVGKKYERDENEKKEKQTDKERDILGINEILKRKVGNCDDISATYFSLLNYFNIPCCFKIGQTFGKSFLSGYKKITTHVWNSTNVEYQEIDFDGTWYEKFVPLKSTPIEKITFKEEFMVHK